MAKSDVTKLAKSTSETEGPWPHGYTRIGAIRTPRPAPGLTARERQAATRREARQVRRAQVEGWQRVIDDWRRAGYRYVIAYMGGKTSAHRARPGPCLTNVIVAAIERSALLSPANTIINEWRCTTCIKRVSA